jgi:hypothetical protein
MRTGMQNICDGVGCAFMRTDNTGQRDGFRCHGAHECTPYGRQVKRGLVGHPREWPFSSWHRDAGGAVW